MGRPRVSRGAAAVALLVFTENDEAATVFRYSEWMDCNAA